MGLMGDWLRGRRMRNPVRGIADEGRVAEAASMNRGRARSGNDLVDQLRAAFPGAEITVSPHQPNLSDFTGGDSVERLERLAALHRSGALTDEEFAAAKARLLG